jgi:hypothetical protein
MLTHRSLSSKNINNINVFTHTQNESDGSTRLVTTVTSLFGPREWWKLGVEMVSLRGWVVFSYPLREVE